MSDMQMRLIFWQTWIESLASIHGIIHCSVHFQIDTFTDNDHDGHVQFSSNLTQKGISYKKDVNF